MLVVFYFWTCFPLGSCNDKYSSDQHERLTSTTYVSYDFLCQSAITNSSFSTSSGSPVTVPLNGLPDHLSSNHLRRPPSVCDLKTPSLRPTMPSLQNKPQVEFSRAKYVNELTVAHMLIPRHVEICSEGRKQQIKLFEPLTVS